MKEIIEIARFLFDDKEFSQIEKFINNKDYSGLVGLIEEEKELTSILLSFDSDNIELQGKFIMLQEIDKLIVDLYLGVEITQ